MHYMKTNQRSNVNTLGRSYANHLRDALGYAGRVDTAGLNQATLREALYLVNTTQSEIERARVQKGLASNLKKDHQDRMGTYAAKLGQSRKSASELIERLDVLSKQGGCINEDGVKDLENICETLAEGIGGMAWAISTSKSISEQILMYSKAEDRMIDLYNPVEGLLKAMGISEPEKLSVLDYQKRTVDMPSLARLQESAKYLIRKMGASRSNALKAPDNTCEAANNVWGLIFFS